MLCCAIGYLLFRGVYFLAYTVFIKHACRHIFLFETVAPTSVYAKHDANITINYLFSLFIFILNRLFKCLNYFANINLLEMFSICCQV